MKPQVLVVDDEKTIADGLRLTLESEGFAVRTAGSVREALAAFTQCDPHAAMGAQVEKVLGAVCVV
ncbi:MAG: hypothetical protein AABZ83_01215, partial [candidate division NC10 bacterium]